MPIDPLTTAITATVTWIVDKYGELIIDKMAEGVAGKREDRAQHQAWKRATTTYLRKLHDEVNRLNVLGKMGQTHSLGEIYTDVNLLDELSANRRYGVSALEAEFVARRPWRSEDKKRRDGLEVVARERRLFILGKPGAGKTTFLKHIALHTIKANAQKDGDKKLPIFVTLKELSDSGQALVPFIAEQFRRADFPEAETFVYQLLKAGDAVVLLDGVDEVNQEDNQRDEMIGWIKNFVQEFDRCQILLTCRVAAVGYSFKAFAYVEMADFSPLQQRNFIFRWFENSQNKRDCWQALQESQNETLQELARIPLLLSLLCVVFEAHKAFPVERHKLYQEATQALLGDWDKQDKLIQRDSIYDGLSQQRREQLLAYIAIETFAEGAYFINEERLVGLIEDYLKKAVGIPEPDGPYVLAAMEAQHGLLVERAKGIHSFSHLTLQEYFTANYLVANEVTEVTKYLMRYIGDNRWRETFLLTAAMFNNAVEFAQNCLEGLANLAAQDEVISSILEWSATRSTNLPSGVRPSAGRIFNLFLVFALDRELDPDLSRVRALTLTLAHDFGPASIFTNYLDLNSANILDIDIDFDLAIALDIAVTHNLNLITEMASTTAGIVMQLPVWSQHLELLVQERLSKLCSLHDEATADGWKTFNAELESILLEYWRLEQFWEIDQAQIELLEQYLQGNLLLLECMELTRVPDQEAIMDRMLLPPG